MNIEIKTTEEINAAMNEILSKFDKTSKLDHEYYQVLAIHNKVADTQKRLDKVEDKLDKVLSRLDYLCATESEKRYLYPNGNINYDAICEMCDTIEKDMKEMRE